VTDHYLLHNLILFGRLLRALGLDINPGRMIDLVQALEHVNLARKSDFYFTARSLLVHDRKDLPLFDQAFALFWRAPREKTLFSELFQAGMEAPRDEPLVTAAELEKLEQDSDANGEDER
jgi:hypothetical protein